MTNTTTASQSVSAPAVSPSTGPDIAVIAAAVGGTLAALLVIGVVAFLLLRRRQPPARSLSDYGDVSAVRAPHQNRADIGAVRKPASEYEAVSSPLSL